MQGLPLFAIGIIMNEKSSNALSTFSVLVAESGFHNVLLGSAGCDRADGSLEAATDRSAVVLCHIGRHKHLIGFCCRRSYRCAHRPRRRLSGPAAASSEKR